MATVAEKQKAATGRWYVDAKGDPSKGSFELSVLRGGNERGFRSWGWFDENKILISHSGAGKVAIPELVWVKLRQAAQQIADELNAN